MTASSGAQSPAFPMPLGGMMPPGWPPSGQPSMPLPPKDAAGLSLPSIAGPIVFDESVKEGSFSISFKKNRRDQLLAYLHTQFENNQPQQDQQVKNANGNEANITVTFSDEATITCQPVDDSMLSVTYRPSLAQKNPNPAQMLSRMAQKIYAIFLAALAKEGKVPSSFDGFPVELTFKRLPTGVATVEEIAAIFRKNGFRNVTIIGPKKGKHHSEATPEEKKAWSVRPPVSESEKKKTIDSFNEAVKEAASQQPESSEHRAVVERYLEDPSAILDAPQPQVSFPTGMDWLSQLRFMLASQLLPPDLTPEQKRIESLAKKGEVDLEQLSTLLDAAYKKLDPHTKKLDAARTLSFSVATLLLNISSFIPGLSVNVPYLPAVLSEMAWLLLAQVGVERGVITPMIEWRLSGKCSSAEPIMARLAKMAPSALATVLLRPYGMLLTMIGAAAFQVAANTKIGSSVASSLPALFGKGPAEMTAARSTKPPTTLVK